MAAPDLVVIGDGDLEVTVVPDVGARLHRVKVFGHDVLRGAPQIDDYRADPFFWGGFVMAPWCNRITPGPVEIGGRRVDLPSNFRDGTAIHGQVYAAPWQQIGEGRFAIDREGDGWPWPYRVELEVRVSGSELTVEQTLRNRSDVEMPGGIGLHPWFVGRIEIAIDADDVFASNEESTPQPEPVSGDLDLRNPRVMRRGVDAAWPDAREPQVVMVWRDLGIRAEMWADAPDVCIVAAAPTDVDAIAVEPETHAPQGMRRLLNGEPGGLALIPPDGALTLRTRYSFTD